MISKILAALTALGMISGLASVSQAQILLPQDRGYLGILAGHSKTSGIDGRFGFGAEGGLRFTNGWTGLLFFENSDGDSDGVDTQIMHYGLGVNYELAQWVPGLGIGAKIGMGSYDSTSDAGDADDSGFSYGPVISYDYMLNEAFSLGGQVQHLWTNWEDTENTTAVYLTGKFWL